MIEQACQFIILNMKTLQNNPKIAQIQSRLNKYPFLSKTTLPGQSDGRVFQTLETIRRYPDRSSNPNFYHWYILMRQFSTATTTKWISEQLYSEGDDSLVADFVKLYAVRKDEGGAEERPIKDAPHEFQYTVDIYMNGQVEDRMRQIEIILEQYKAEVMEISEKQKSKFIRVLCRMEPARSEQMVNRISACIQTGNIEIKKRPMKANSIEKIIES